MGPGDLLGFSNWGTPAKLRKSDRARYCALAESSWQMIDRGVIIVPSSSADGPTDSGAGTSSQWLRLQDSRQATMVFVIDLHDRLTADFPPDSATMDAISEAIGKRARISDFMLL